MDAKAITRRLEALQRAADKSRPCHMVVTFTDGHQVIADPCGAIDLCRERGSNIARITADQPGYRAAAAILTVICHAAPNRRIEDFE